MFVVVKIVRVTASCFVSQSRLVRASARQENYNDDNDIHGSDGDEVNANGAMAASTITRLNPLVQFNPVYRSDGGCRSIPERKAMKVHPGNHLV